MITKQDFYKYKIFAGKDIFEIRRQYPQQINEINEWFRSSDYKAISSYKSSLLQKLKKVLIDDEILIISGEQLYSIYQWWISQTKECHYCKIKETELEELRNIPGHINKRYPKRGKSLEIDRKKSDLPYTNVSNLVLACYWCNNAKTDTFTESEFLKIGKVIQEIWNDRFEKKT